MRTYVINLPRSPERRTAMVAQLRASGLEYEFVEAVDGRVLTADERAELVDEVSLARYPSWSTPGAIGCTLSHKRVHERIVASGDPHALVLEDDAKLDPELGGIVGDLTTHLRPDEIMLLHFRSSHYVRCQVSRDGATAAGRHQIMTPTNLDQYVSALAYLVGADAAATLASKALPLKCPIDAWWFLLETGVIGSVRCVLPRPVRQAVAYESTIDRGDRRLRQRITHQPIWPMPQLRALNRYRVVRNKLRVDIVD